LQKVWQFQPFLFNKLISSHKYLSTFVPVLASENLSSGLF